MLAVSWYFGRVLVLLGMVVRVVWWCLKEGMLLWERGKVRKEGKKRYSLALSHVAV
jgi:hypothetical protein